jgi:heme-degrading monooxygenase HmoA
MGAPQRGQRVVPLMARHPTIGVMIARTPEPPYLAVIFSSQRTAEEHAEYNEMADTLERLAPDQPGFLGIESARDAAGFGITVSYWKDDASIAAWKANAVHREAQHAGARWYAQYKIRVARVER